MESKEKLPETRDQLMDRIAMIQNIRIHVMELEAEEAANRYQIGLGKGLDMALSII